MLYLIYTMMAGAAGGVLLTLASEGFAYEMSRVLEAALDSVEYRRALRTKRRGASRGHGSAARLRRALPGAGRSHFVTDTVRSISA